jgi:hypothetical protein
MHHGVRRAYSQGPALGKMLAGCAVEVDSTRHQVGLPRHAIKRQ